MLALNRDKNFLKINLNRPLTLTDLKDTYLWFDDTNKWVCSRNYCSWLYKYKKPLIKDKNLLTDSSFRRCFLKCASREIFQLATFA